MSSKPVMAHAQHGDSHIVAAQLRVLITQESCGNYVAQGLEIDYCATGHSVEEVQERFATGFLRTVESLIRTQRPLGALFKSRTPPETWQEYIDSSRQDELACGTIVDLSKRLPPDVGLPYQALAFCSPRQLSLA